MEVIVQLLMAIEREERVVVKTWGTGDDLEMISGEPGLSWLGIHVCIDSVAICRLRRLEASTAHRKIVQRSDSQDRGRLYIRDYSRALHRIQRTHRPDQATT